MRSKPWTVQILSGFCLCLGFAYAAPALSECYSQTQADQYIQEFSLGPKTFKGGNDLCQPKGQFVQFLKTLDFIRDTPVDLNQRLTFVPGIVKTSYFDYLKLHIRFANGPLRGCRSGPSTMACVEGTGELAVGESFFAQPLAIRASAIIHELRHLEGNFPHAKCTQGNELGVPKGCDETFSSQGSYAVQVEYLIRLFLSAGDLSDSERLAAKGLALYLIENKFNQPLNKGVPAAVLVEEGSGRLAIFDGQKLQWLKQTIGEGRLIARDRNFVFLSSDRSAPVNLVDPYFEFSKSVRQFDGEVDAIGRAFVDYNQNWPTEKRLGLLDSLRLGNRGEQLMLFADHLEIAGPKNLTTLKLDLQVGARSFERDSPCALNGLIRGNSNWDVEMDSGGNFHLKLSACTFPEDALNFVRLGMRAFVLTGQGEVKERLEDGSLYQTTTLVGLNDLKFRQMIRFKESFYWELLR